MLSNLNPNENIVNFGLRIEPKIISRCEKAFKHLEDPKVMDEFITSLPSVNKLKKTFIKKPKCTK